MSTDDPARVEAKAAIVEEVERLRWRLWNGKAKDAQISIGRIRKVIHAFQGEPGSRQSDAPSRKLWTVLHELNGYLTGQSNWLVNYAKRHRAGLRVGTALTEATANFLVNRRMNKSQQMRWTRRGADLLLQVRCAAYNGTLGSGFGQRFDPAGCSTPTNGIGSLTPRFWTVPLTTHLARPTAIDGDWNLKIETKTKLKFFHRPSKLDFNEFYCLRLA